MAELSPALVRRLPQYFRALIKLYSSGKERVSSDELASELGLVPSQVRTDLKALGCTGQRSYGYGIPTLYKRIADILQLSDKFSAVIAGSGDIVRAISKTEVFTKRGVKLTAVFSDRDTEKDYQRQSVFPLGAFEEKFAALNPDIVIFGGEADEISPILNYLNSLKKNECKLPEIWNFTPTDIASDTLTVRNIHLSDYVMLLCYKAGKSEAEGE